ncbi:response regulator [Nakamurella multipartita]|jgi:DNA-binding response OmpR family regulator|uniref:Response regulator receiver protein n=1 Tax=Nakamurella multipartita (strain ATCC 700099 / DSM 44233 / CIP 104796 / JCM 9543 / NBRC 105858 / Y-104) TaxID=479431 RepID=C8XCX5_NAKMY|nr:response regulator receiver protein [Nakamurella multipartita DSM 44233]
MGGGWERGWAGSAERVGPGTTIEPVSNPVLLVYSNRPEIRERIITAIGRRPAPDVGRVDYLECAAVHEVMTATQGRQADVLILDGEAQPSGGIGISRQIHQEAQVIPPVILVVRRADDRWLATWAGADEILVYPLDPVTAAETVAAVLRRRSAGLVTAVTDTP